MTAAGPKRSAAILYVFQDIIHGMSFVKYHFIASAVTVSAAGRLSAPIDTMPRRVLAL